MWWENGWQCFHDEMNICASGLQCYGVMGLRIVFMSLQGAKDRHSLLEEVLMLFRALRGHPRMRFLVMCRPPQEPNKEHLTSSTMQNFADGNKTLSRIRMHTETWKAHCHGNMRNQRFPAGEPLIHQTLPSVITLQALQLCYLFS